jgi:hypothetical protein
MYHDIHLETYDYVMRLSDWKSVGKTVTNHIEKTGRHDVALPERCGPNPRL